MPKVTINRPAPGTVVAAGQSVTVSGKATGTGGAEPHVIDSVMVGIDGSGAVAAQVTPVPHQLVPTVLFAASVAVPAAGGGHQIMVSATEDDGLRASATVSVVVPASTSVYPRFTPTARPILDELAAVAANRDVCSSIYLDTLESHSHDELPFGIDWEGEDHHQGLARTQQLTDGSVVFFPVPLRDRRGRPGQSDALPLRGTDRGRARADHLSADRGPTDPVAGDRGPASVRHVVPARGQERRLRLPVCGRAEDTAGQGVPVVCCGRSRRARSAAPAAAYLRAELCVHRCQRRPLPPRCRPGL